MTLMEKILDFVSGGSTGAASSAGQAVIDGIRAYFPPKLSDAEKAQIESAALAATRANDLKLIGLVQDEQREFDQQIKDMEGTAADLKQAGWPGRVILFLRGAQRPIWGFFVMVLDFMVFSGKWKLATLTAAAGLDVTSAFWVINFLVLGFLFGERAAKNVLPLLGPMIQKGKA